MANINVGYIDEEYHRARIYHLVCLVDTLTILANTAVSQCLLSITSLHLFQQTYTPFTPEEFKVIQGRFYPPAFLCQ